METTIKLQDITFLLPVLLQFIYYRPAQNRCLET